MDVAVVGATGYTGIELIKILSQHPEVCLTQLTTRQKEPRPLKDFIPSLPKDSSLKLTTFNFKEVAANSEIVFFSSIFSAYACQRQNKIDANHKCNFWTPKIEDR